MRVGKRSRNKGQTRETQFYIAFSKKCPQILDIGKVDMKTWARKNFFVLFLLLQPLVLRWEFILMHVVCGQTVEDAVSDLSTYLRLWGFTTPARFTLFFMLSPRGSDHHSRLGACPWVGFTSGNEKRRVFAFGHRWYWTQSLASLVHLQQRERHNFWKSDTDLTELYLKNKSRSVEVWSTWCFTTSRTRMRELCHYALNWYQTAISVWCRHFCHIAPPRPFTDIPCACI